MGSVVCGKRADRKKASAGSGWSALPDLASRYTPRDAPVTPGRYRGFYEQEPTTGEGVESEIEPKRFIE